MGGRDRNSHHLSPITQNQGMMVSKTSRRAFLGTIGGLAVGVLAACQAPPPATTPKPAATPKPDAAAKPTQQAPAAAQSAATEQPFDPLRPPAPIADVNPKAPASSARTSPKRGGELRIV